MSEFAPYETPSPPPTRGLRLPAEYYSLPPGDIKPLFPRGLRIGCGVASAVFIVGLFAAGGWLSGGGAGRALAWMLGAIQADLGGMYDKEVTRSQQAALDAELLRLQGNVERGRLPITKVQTVLGILRSAISDRRLTRAEVDQITKTAHDANATAAPPGKTSP